jgi:polar amino acid transport system ATP-binding protein
MVPIWSFEEKWLTEYRKGIGVVFQAYNLFPHWTSVQNIVMPLVKVHGKIAS